MPKRSAEEKIQHYEEKIRKLKHPKEKKKRRRRVIISSDDDDQVEKSQQDQSPQEQDTTENQENLTDSSRNTQADTDPPPAPATAPPLTDPELDPELLLALGESATDSPDFGVNILDKQANIWLEFLKKGIPKECKENLLKEYNIPYNCRLLQAPKLNAEIAAAIPDMVRNRDKATLQAQQKQLGSGITAICRATDILLLGGDKAQAIRHLSNSCRLLTDLHFSFTQCRTKLITPSLDKTCLNIMQEAERDETLFGSQLGEKIKAAKAIERQGLQIKKAPPQKTSTSQPTGARPAYQGNWHAPPRYLSNRGRGRGGYRHPAPAAAGPRRNYQPSSQRNAPQNKPRATTTTQQ